MGVLLEITNLLLITFFNLYLMAVLLRFLLQWSRADFYNPISQFLVKVTHPLLKPLRRVIPGFWGLDMASLVLALIVQLTAIATILLVNGYSLPASPVVLAWPLIGCASAILNIYFFTILASIILSWVAPGSYHPAVQLLHQLSEPVMAPFRRMLPDTGGIDFSPILVFILINVLQVVLRELAVNTSLPTILVMGL